MTYFEWAASLPIRSYDTWSAETHEITGFVFYNCRINNMVSGCYCDERHWMAMSGNSLGSYINNQRALNGYGR